MMKALFAMLICLSLGMHAKAQITLIPDSFFELYLGNAGIDTDGIINGQVLTSDIADETELHLWGLLIEDLTGIEDFASLEFLDINEMNISSLDLSQNSNLQQLIIGGLNLINLDLSQNVNLQLLFMAVLNLVSLDISQNLNLTYVILEFSSDPLLNKITHIDVSNNLLLDNFSIYRGFITSVDVSNNTLLEQFQLYHMEDLETVNLKNGNNEIINFLRIQDNINLACVQVDDPAAVMAGNPPYNNWIIENDPLITDDCQLGVEEALENKFVVYPNPARTQVYLENHKGLVVHKLQVYDALGRMVLEKKIDLDTLDVSALQSGLFTLRIETDIGVFSNRLLKQ
jgi:hypothetical protein